MYNVGYEYDQRRGKKHTKSMKSREAHKPGATHRRGDEPRDRAIRYRLNGCLLSGKRMEAYMDSYDPANWLPAAPKPAPVAVQSTKHQRNPNPRVTKGQRSKHKINKTGKLRLATR
jgi:hypothetical protein